MILFQERAVWSDENFEETNDLAKFKVFFEILSLDTERVANVKTLGEDWTNVEICVPDKIFHAMS